MKTISLAFLAAGIAAGALLSLASCSMPFRGAVEGGVYVIHKPPIKFEKRTPEGTDWKTEGLNPIRLRDRKAGKESGK